MSEAADLISVWHCDEIEIEMRAAYRDGHWLN